MSVDLVIRHLPFAFAVVLLYTVGQVLKLGPLSAERATQVPWVRFVRRWLPLPLQLISAGAILGLVPHMPVSLPVPSVVYYTAAGLISVIGRNVYSEWKKHGVEGAIDAVANSITVDDVSSTPPAR